ncbi:MAG TPA: hypothetical protein PKD00_10185, partial [Burkholderiales bacterium]|nr:hypothetical protein [Burkholderiales bacterium]
MINQKNKSSIKDLKNIDKLRIKKKYQVGSTDLKKDNILPIEEGLPQVELPTFTVENEKPYWLIEKERLEKIYPKYKGNKFLKTFLPKRYKSSLANYNEYKDYAIKEGIASKILTTKPYTNNLTADRYMYSLSDAEREILRKSDTWDKTSKTYLDKLVQGTFSPFRGLVPPTAFKKAGSPVARRNGYTEQEAKESSLWDAVEGGFGYLSKPLQGLTNAVGATNFKDAQGKNYTLKQGLLGKQNDAGFIADAVTDATNFVGPGLIKSLVKKGPDLLKLGKSHIKDIKDAFNYHLMNDLDNLQRNMFIDLNYNTNKFSINYPKLKIDELKNQDPYYTDRLYSMEVDSKLKSISYDRNERIKKALHRETVYKPETIPQNITILENGILVSDKTSAGSNFIKSKAVRTTDNSTPEKLINFRTGEEVPIKVSYSNNEDKEVLYSLNDKKQLIFQNLSGEANKIKEFEVNPEYVETLNDNMKYVEEQFPGSKPIGSSVGVTKAGLATSTNDIDIIMARSDYDKYKISEKFPDFYPNGPAIAHIIDRKLGEAGKIDVNIIDNDVDGFAEGFQAVQLFRQFFPDEYYKASQEAIKRALKEGKNIGDVSIKINKTAEELVEAMDPTLKTIMDSYETSSTTLRGINSNKEKHINRIDYYINYGNVEKVKEAQLKFTQSIVGSKGDVGKQFPISEFSDIEKNKKILEKIEFIGDIEKVAKEPERMQLALNDHYINNSIYNRQVNWNTEYLKTIEDVVDSFITWKGIGASAMGNGLNTVKLGYPAHITYGLIGSKQFKLYDDSIKNIDDYLFQIRKKTSGEYEFNKEELESIKKIGAKYSIDTKDIKKASDLLFIRHAEVDIMQPFLKEVGQELKTKAIINGNFGNSLYSTDLGVFDKDLDNLTIALFKEHNALKSYRERKETFKQFGQKHNEISSIDTKAEFYKLQNLINGGLEKNRNRYREASNQYDNLIKKRQKLIDELQNKPVTEEQRERFIKSKIDEYEKQIENILKEKEIFEKEYNELAIRFKKLDKIHNTYTTLGKSTIVGSAVGAVGLGINEIIDNEREERKRLGKSLKALHAVRVNSVLTQKQKEINADNIRMMVGNDLWENGDEETRQIMLNKASTLSNKDFETYIDSLNFEKKFNKKLINTLIINNNEKKKYGGNMNKKLAIRK